MAQGTLSKVGDSVTFTGTAGSAGNFAGLYGTFSGLTIAFAASQDGTAYSPATAHSLTGGGGHSIWSPASNTPNMWSLDDLQAGASVRVTCTAITSGSATVFIGNRPPGAGTQTVPYTATMTPDPNQGKVFTIAPTDTNAMTIAAPAASLSGQEIVFDILNSSGGSMGTITWNALYKLAGAFSNPANGKRRTITFVYNGSAWVEMCRAAADI